MEKYEQKAEKCVVSNNFKPNKTFWIATNTNYIEVPNTNFTKYVKIDLIQIKFFQIFPNANITNPNLTKCTIHRTPKYCYFESFFSICKYQMSCLDDAIHV